MVYLSLVIVLLVTLVFFLLDKKAYKWWEFFIPFIVTIGMIIGTKAIIDHTSVTFIEYWGETIIEIYEQEPYNWWHVKTCTETYPCGTDSEGNTKYCTRTYDCSEQENEPPRWWCKTNLGNRYNISEHLYDSLLYVWSTNRQIVKTYKNHDSRDKAVGSKGTKFEGTRVGVESYVYRVKWDNKDHTRKGVFTKHKYENRIKASDLSIFNIAVVTEEEADSMGLYEYPEDWDIFNSPVFLGPDVSPKSQELFRKLNAKFGPSNQLRLWILIFEDKPAITAQYQENYWVKGNKNELVICIGKKGKDIQWAHSFSWALSGTLTAETAQKVLEMYEYTVTTDDNRRLPVALPIVTKPLKQVMSDGTGIDTSMIPPVLPLPVPKQNITNITKSTEPVFTEQTLKAYYDYLNNNLHRFERRSFEEFSYVKVDPKPKHIIIIYVLALLVSLGVNLWAYNNDIHDKEDHRYSRYNSYKRRRF